MTRMDPWTVLGWMLVVAFAPAAALSLMLGVVFMASLRARLISHHRLAGEMHKIELHANKESDV